MGQAATVKGERGLGEESDSGTARRKTLDYNGKYDGKIVCREKIERLRERNRKRRDIKREKEKELYRERERKGEDHDTRRKEGKETLRAKISRALASFGWNMELLG